MTSEIVARRKVFGNGSGRPLTANEQGQLDGIVARVAEHDAEISRLVEDRRVQIARLVAEAHALFKQWRVAESWSKWSAEKFHRSKGEVSKLLKYGRAADPDAAVAVERETRRNGMAEQRASVSHNAHVGNSALDQVEKAQPAPDPATWASSPAMPASRVSEEDPTVTELQPDPRDATIGELRAEIAKLTDDLDKATTPTVTEPKSTSRFEELRHQVLGNLSDAWNQATGEQRRSFLRSRKSEIKALYVEMRATVKPAEAPEPAKVSQNTPAPSVATSTAAKFPMPPALDGAAGSLQLPWNEVSENERPKVRDYILRGHALKEPPPPIALWFMTAWSAADTITQAGFRAWLTQQPVEAAA